MPTFQVGCVTYRWQFEDSFESLDAYTDAELAACVYLLALQLGIASDGGTEILKRQTYKTFTCQDSTSSRLIHVRSNGAAGSVLLHLMLLAMAGPAHNCAMLPLVC